VCGHDFVLGTQSSEPSTSPTGLLPVTPPPPVGPPSAGHPGAGIAARTGGVAEAVAQHAGGTAGSGALPRRNGAPTGWRVVASADPEHHARMRDAAMPDAPAIPFPTFCPDRRFPLSGAEVLIGRRRPSRGIEPAIDLTGPPEDAAISHAHALLVPGPEGTWAVVDLDSANGTYLNSSIEPIEPHQPVPLREGDRIHIGAWTTLTIQRADPA
jgi:hypothetical protein